MIKASSKQKKVTLSLELSNITVQELENIRLQVPISSNITSYIFRDAHRNKIFPRLYIDNVNASTHFLKAGNT